MPYFEIRFEKMHAEKRVAMFPHLGRELASVVVNFLQYFLIYCKLHNLDPRRSQLRSGLNHLFIFSILREARSRLYRRQILQVNIRWKALDEIYKIYMLLHRSDLNISETIYSMLPKL